MKQGQVMQFVYFETILNPQQFIAQWEHFTRSSNGDLDVRIHQSEQNGLLSYIAQHCCMENQFQFIFEKARRSSKQREVYIKAELAGGYSPLQIERTNDVRADERRVFAFVVNSKDNLDIYRQLCPGCDLNIYQPYYENCSYAYVLEFFLKTQDANALLDQLKHHHVARAGIYKECILQFSPNSLQTV